MYFHGMSSLMIKNVEVPSLKWLAQIQIHLLTLALHSSKEKEVMYFPDTSLCTA